LRTCGSRGFLERSHYRGVSAAHRLRGHDIFVR